MTECDNFMRIIYDRACARCPEKGHVGGRWPRYHKRVLKVHLDAKECQKDLLQPGVL